MIGGIHLQIHTCWEIDKARGVDAGAYDHKPSGNIHAATCAAELMNWHAAQKDELMNLL